MVQKDVDDIKRADQARAKAKAAGKGQKSLSESGTSNPCAPAPAMAPSTAMLQSIGVGNDDGWMTARGKIAFRPVNRSPAADKTQSTQQVIAQEISEE